MNIQPLRPEIRDIINKMNESAAEALEEESEAMTHTDSDLIPEKSFPFEILPDELQKFVNGLSKALCVPASFCAAATLPIIGGALGNTLRVKPKTGWDVPPFIWLMAIGETGCGKSPVIHALMEPLNKLQIEEYKKYSEMMKEWERVQRKAKKDPEIDVSEKPILKHFKLTDFTIETLVDIFHDDPHGVTIYRDELAGLFLSLNQYKNGKGSDRQQMLELFNCSPMKVDRKNKTVVTTQSGASIIGGLQPRVMRDIFTECCFDDGLLPRFLMMNIDAMPKEFSRAGIPEDGEQYWNDLVNWVDCLRNFYKEPITLPFFDEALDIFENFYNRYHSVEPFLSPRAGVFVPKLITYCLRLAGVLHSMQAYPDVERLNSSVSAKTITNAVSLIEYFAGQVIKSLKMYEAKSESDLNEFQKRLIGVLQRLQSNVNNGLLMLKTIRNEFNKNIPESIQYTPEGIKSLLTRLGLQTKKGTKNLSFLIWENEKIKKLFTETTVTTVTPSTSEGTKYP